MLLKLGELETESGPDSACSQNHRVLRLLVCAHKENPLSNNPNSLLASSLDDSHLKANSGKLARHRSEYKEQSVHTCIAATVYLEKYGTMIPTTSGGRS